MFANRKEKAELLDALVVSDKDATIIPNYSQVFPLVIVTHTMTRLIRNHLSSLIVLSI